MTVSAVNDLECLALMSQTLIDLECKLPAHCLARLKVASDSRFKNLHKARQSFASGHFAGSLDSFRDDEEDEELFTPIHIKSVDELVTGRTLGTGSFGRVRIATHKPSGQILALKALQKEAIRLTRQEKNIMSEREVSCMRSPVNVSRSGDLRGRD